MKKSLALIIPIVLLALALLFVLYKFNKTNKENKATISQLTDVKQKLETELAQLSLSYDSLQTDNKNLQDEIALEKAKIGELIKELKLTKENSVKQINRYYNEVSGLKDQLQTYITQIDSLNEVNRQLTEDNQRMREQVIDADRQIVALKEQQSDMMQSLEKSKRLEAMNIASQGLKQNNKATNKAKKVKRIKVNFILSKNNAYDGEQLDLYVVVSQPNGRVIGNPGGNMFKSSSGDKIYTIKRQVLYSGNYLPVAMFYDGKSFISGRYNVEIFAGENSIGKSSFTLK